MRIARRRGLIVGMAVGAAAASHAADKNAKQQQAQQAQQQKQTTTTVYVPVPQGQPQQQPGQKPPPNAYPGYPPAGYPPAGYPPPQAGYPGYPPAPYGYPPGAYPPPPGGYPPPQQGQYPPPGQYPPGPPPGQYPPGPPPAQYPPGPPGPVGYPPAPQGYYPPAPGPCADANPPPYQPAAAAQCHQQPTATANDDTYEKLKKFEKRYFNLVNESNCYVLEVPHDHPKPGSSVGLEKRKSDKPAHQLWFVDEDGFIKSKINDLCLSVKDKGEKVRLAQYNGDARQQWILQGNKIVNKTFCSECIGLKKGLVMVRDDADIISCKYEGKPYQHWRVEYVA